MWIKTMIINALQANCKTKEECKSFVLTHYNLDIRPSTLFYYFTKYGPSFIPKYRRVIYRDKKGEVVVIQRLIYSLMDKNPKLSEEDLYCYLDDNLSTTYNPKTVILYRKQALFRLKSNKT